MNQALKILEEGIKNTKEALQREQYEPLKASYKEKLEVMEKLVELYK
jgi:hypothetical protein